MKRELSLLLLPCFIIVLAQENPCIVYERPKFSTGLHAKTAPIFPGCETFQDNNDLLNHCVRNLIAHQIAFKMNLEFSLDSKIDSANLLYYKTVVIMDVDTSGKLTMKLEKRKPNLFEDKLEEKLDEISNETKEIIPAITEKGYCSKFRYRLPISFNLKDSEYIGLY